MSSACYQMSQEESVCARGRDTSERQKHVYTRACVQKWTCEGANGHPWQIRGSGDQGFRAGVRQFLEPSLANVK